QEDAESKNDDAPHRGLTELANSTEGQEDAQDELHKADPCAGPDGGDIPQRQSVLLLPDRDHAQHRVRALEDESPICQLDGRLEKEVRQRKDELISLDDALGCAEFHSTFLAQGAQGAVPTPKGVRGAARWA